MNPLPRLLPLIFLVWMPVAGSGQVTAVNTEQKEPEATPPNAPIDEAKVLTEGKNPTELAALLGHEKFRVRHMAELQLKAQIESDAEAVRDAAYSAYRNSDPEVKMRARAILLEYVTVAQSLRGRGFVGIGLMQHPFFDPAGNMAFGVKVTQVMPNLPGAKAGLAVDDIIIGVDNLILNDVECDQKFMDYVGAKGPGKTIQIKLNRNGEAKVLPVTLTRRPENMLQKNPTDPEQLLREFLKERQSVANKPEAEKSAPAP